MASITTGAADLSSQAHRQQTALNLSPVGSNPLAVSHGVHAGLNFSKTTGMGFKIGPGRAAVNGATPVDGPMTSTILTDEVGAFAPGDATRDRIDAVVLQTNPALASTEATKVVVVQGAYGAGAPATPSGALLLYHMPIPAGMSAANGGIDASRVIDRRIKVGMQDFIPYTPNFSGFISLGTNAVREGRYRINGDKVEVHVHLKGGKGALLGVAGLQSFTLPVPTNSPQGWLYYGNGGLHHPNRNGLAYDLRVLADGTNGVIFATSPNGAMGNAGHLQYPFLEGTDIYLNIEYIGAFGQ